LTPEEVKNYLKAFSASNKRVKSPQFHATISCKGREYDKEQLSHIAEKWLTKMGYGENPYIIVFHSDTENNHVHIVSTRVGKDGKKIDDRFDRPRAIRHLDEILKQGNQQTQAAAIRNIESYSFSTLAQFKMLFEKANFSIKEKDGVLYIYKSAEQIKTYSPEELGKMMASYTKDAKRLVQLRQIIAKYKPKTDSSLGCIYQKLPGNRDGKLAGYQSDLTNLLRQRFGIEFIFHFKGNNTPYGYTVIDHKMKLVFKGSELMKLNQLINQNVKPVKSSKKDKMVKLLRHYNIETPEHIRLLSRFYSIPAYRIPNDTQKLDMDVKDHYKKMLDYYLKHRPLSDVAQLNIVPVKESGKWYLLDTGSLHILSADEILPGKYVSELEQGRIQTREFDRFEHNNELNLNVFTNDEDDERIHGRKRRKKKRDNP
ncbi:relaxase/mobilization nuclease domain-containing protein, partial [bacterium]|nr:relaxase/mobilization nuclease domain-containing protein [bacterium]